MEAGINEILTGGAEAIFGGVVAGLVSWGGIKTAIDYHKEDIKEVKAIAVDALAKAERAITILDERKKGRD